MTSGKRGAGAEERGGERTGGKGVGQKGEESAQVEADLTPT